jgi:hypothetical protein
MKLKELKKPLNQEKTEFVLKKIGSQYNKTNYGFNVQKTFKYP